MKGFKDTTRVQYFRGGQVTREKACGGMVKKAEGGKVTKGRETFDNDSDRGSAMRIAEFMTDTSPLSPKLPDGSKRDKSNKSTEKLFGKATPSPQKIHDYIVNKPTKKAEGGRVTDPIKNKTGGKNDPEYGDYAISKVEKTRTRVLTPKDSQYSKPGRSESMGNVIYNEDPKSPYPNTGSRKPVKKAEGGKVDMKQDKKTVATGVHKHERNMHPGKPLTKMQRGGFPAHSSAPLIKAR